ncbi:hypothetical protein [Poritiphilus flavus]|uniref:Uncharacterized protein n=1 Tax=Poritiphilus flavus TaxID=2697053 RepID=A0A6L9EGR3_9FLAO|nr:hypothetical protein [Poritiphilus flavus]NAS13871.1 hypothetical protein [Poritiphilus flavus]
MEEIKKVQKWIYANMVWLLIIVAFLLFILSKIGVFSINVNLLLEKLSFTVLSSGVFAAVLKSIQFTGIFKSVIEEIILGTDFIENRSEKNQQELWKATSKAIYKKKFPELSDLVENRILQTYLPTTKKHYNRDFVITINISEINDDFVISYTQTFKYDIVLDESVDESEIISKLSISQEDEESGFKNDIIFYTVNDKDVEPEEIDNDNKNYVVTKVPLISENGNRVFRIHKKVERRYSLKNENYKLIRMATFTKGIDVVISFPENVGVSFFNIGNVNFFEEEHVDVKNQISRSHRNDVILPFQGFGMSFELKNNVK